MHSQITISLLTDIVTPTYVFVILIDINGKYTTIWTYKVDTESTTFLIFPSLLGWGGKQFLLLDPHTD